MARNKMEKQIEELLQNVDKIKNEVMDEDEDENQNDLAVKASAQ